jgi:hypothetical protein
MRLSWALSLALCWAPALSNARVLAQAGPLSLGDGGQDALPADEARGLRASIDLPFTLSQSAEVQAQAEGLRHLRDDRDAAPEAFIDDEYLGPLLGVHGSTWRSSRSLQLGPGPHHFILRNAAVADAEDFVLKRIFVYATGPDEAVAKGQSPAAKALSGPAPENGCSGRQTRDWPEQLKQGITLSVLNGRAVGSGSLVTLRQGDAWECYLKLPGSEDQSLALEEGLRAPAGGKGPCSWVFSLDIAPPPTGVDHDYYHPGRWERARAQLCNGHLKLQFAQAPAINIPWASDSLSLEIAAQDVEISLRPAF